MSLVVGLVVTIAYTLAAYVTAERKGLAPGWVIGTFFFTPLYLVLFFLPARVEPPAKPRPPSAFELIAVVILTPLAALLVAKTAVYLSHHKSGGLPACNSRAVANAAIKALEEDDPDSKKIGITGISDSHEVFSTKDARQCRAMVNFRDSSFSRVFINIERQGTGWSLEVSYAD